MVIAHSPLSTWQTPTGSVIERSPLSNAIETYLLSGKVDEKSHETLDTYNIRLSVFVGFTMGTGISSLDDLNSNHIRLFLASLRDRSLKTSTVNAYYRCLHTFFNWCVNEGLSKNFPMNNLRPPKVAKTLIKPFTIEDLQRILMLCSGNSFINIRTRAMVLVLLDTAIRLKELANIQLKDIDFNHETVRIIGKGNKERVVRIGKATQKALLKYLFARGKCDLPGLWLTEEKTQLHHRGVEIALKRLCREAGTSARPSPHTFRHTAAINSLRNGANSFEVQVMLGHSTLDTTKRYVASLTSEQVVESHKRFSPVDNLKLM